ncbi:MAG: arylsulfatase [Proteobacteria bacterium]|nr:arylsulfatase [Pseudomonadota bacterium]HQR04556.1 arylsulfatase [Rhodocyclaceae bacterium]
MDGSISGWPQRLIGVAAWMMAGVASLAVAGPDRTVLPLPEAHYQGKVGRYLADSDKPYFPPGVTAPKGAPNVVLVLLDDVGFGQMGTFGGGIETPALDALAHEGLRYNRFHTTSLCSPTRAALLTGRNHHAVGSGRITELANGYDGYNSIIPKSAATVAEVLRENGYATAMFGKHHNTPDWETGRAGPFDRWPTGLGFEYFYGFLGGDTNQYEPTLYENTVPVPDQPRGANYHLTTDLADHAIDWARQIRAAAPEKPYFLYLATGATHAPHHAPREWIDRFKGRFDRGWDEYRRMTLERQKRLGLVPPDTVLTPRPEGIPAWESLTPVQKKVFARMMEVFAGFTAHTDHEVGRVISALRSLPGGENTLVIYIAGDNGSSAEGGPQGSLNELSILNGQIENAVNMVDHLDELGTDHFLNHFPIAWAHAMDTPFQWYKMVASHLGAMRNGMVISWPARIREHDGIRTQFHHVVDVMPTILEAAGLPVPRSVDGVKQQPMEGTSMVYTFDHPDAPSHRRTQYFELAGNRALYHDGWMASAKFFAVSDFFAGKPIPTDPGRVTWELYDLEHDFSQSRNLAVQEPARLKAMETLFWKEAARNKVLPVSLNNEEDVEGIYRPNPLRGIREFTFTPGIRMPEGSAPNLKNTSFRIEADVRMEPGHTQGVILAQGGRFGGYSLYVKDDRLHFAYNYLNVDHTRISSSTPLPTGRVILAAEFQYEGGRQPGAGGTVTLYADGKLIGTGKVPRTMARRISLSETFDVGFDATTPVTTDYTSPARFGPDLEQVRLRLGDAVSTH